MPTPDSSQPHDARRTTVELRDALDRVLHDPKLRSPTIGLSPQGILLVQEAMSAALAGLTRALHSQR